MRVNPGNLPHHDYHSRNSCPAQNHRCTRAWSQESCKQYSLHAHNISSGSQPNGMCASTKACVHTCKFKFACTWPRQNHREKGVKNEHRASHTMSAFQACYPVRNHHHCRAARTPPNPQSRAVERRAHLGGSWRGSGSDKLPGKQEPPGRAGE